MTRLARFQTHDKDVTVVNLDHHLSSGGQLKMTLDGVETSLTQAQALQLIGVLQSFVSTGKVHIYNNGLTGFNEGDLINIALCREDLSWETIGPYHVTEHNRREAERLGEDLMDELAKQKPRPVVIAMVVPCAALSNPRTGIFDNG